MHPPGRAAPLRGDTRDPIGKLQFDVHPGPLRRSRKTAAPPGHRRVRGDSFADVAGSSGVPGRPRLFAAKQNAGRPFASGLAANTQLRERSTGYSDFFTASSKTFHVSRPSLERGSSR